MDKSICHLSGVLSYFLFPNIFTEIADWNAHSIDPDLSLQTAASDLGHSKWAGSRENGIYHIG